jgi:enoyl-CoA hydratase
LALSIIRDPNFAEGIRAAVVDRDKRPNWIPGRLETVTQDAVQRHFRPIGSDELGLAA